MRKIILEISYLGTKYFGWQKQPNRTSIQQTIESIYKDRLKEEINLTASGRTDAGVHAIKQVAHFETSLNIKAEKFAYILNSFLPPDIRILRSFEGSQNFNARFSAKSKTYLYKMYLSDIELPIFLDRALRISETLNTKAMRKASKALIGTHDFSSFCKHRQNQDKNFVRTIYTIDINHDKIKNTLDIEISGNGFLHNMIRIIVGTLLDVGKGKYNAQDIKNILNEKKRIHGIKTLPPYALYLKDVNYPN